MRLVIACVLLVLTATARAEGFEVGGYAGGTSSSMSQANDCPPSTSPIDLICPSGRQAHAQRRGVAFGLFARASMLPILRLQVDLAYVQKGYEVTEPTFHVDYLEVPLLMRLEPTAGLSPVRWFFHAGIAPALRVRCRNTGTWYQLGPYSVPCGEAPVEPTPSWYHPGPDRFDVSGVVGVGVGVELGWSALEVEYRYVRGIADISAWGPHTKNEASYLLVGWAVMLGGKR